MKGPSADTTSHHCYALPRQKHHGFRMPERIATKTCRYTTTPPPFHLQSRNVLCLLPSDHFGGPSALCVLASFLQKGDSTVADRHGNTIIGNAISYQHNRQRGIHMTVYVRDNTIDNAKTHDCRRDNTTPRLSTRCLLCLCFFVSSFFTFMSRPDIPAGMEARVSTASQGVKPRSSSIFSCYYTGGRTVFLGRVKRVTAVLALT